MTFVCVLDKGVSDAAGNAEYQFVDGEPHRNEKLRKQKQVASVNDMMCKKVEIVSKCNNSDM